MQNDTSPLVATNPRSLMSGLPFLLTLRSS